MTKRRPSASPAPAPTKRCAIYTRKSTTMGLEQEFNSLDAQRDACLAYIQRQPGWTLVDERYDDGGFTGANTDRPAFQRLMAEVEARKVDVIVVYKVDRLSRSLLDFANVMERLSATGASFVSITQNFSTADAMGRLTLNMLMSFAQFEREMISERTRDKIALARQRGKWTGGPVPFGYDVKDKHLVVNEVEAPTVREAFELFLQHRRMATVARMLNERKHLPRGKRLPAGKLPRWTKDTVSRLLHNPLYAGFMKSGEALYPGEHPHLVEEATHQRVQRLLEGGERELCNHGLNPAYVLRGLLRCGQCGAAMVPASTRRGTNEYRYYRCSSRDKHGQKECAAKPLPAGAIEEYVVERLAEATVGGALAADVKEALDARLRKQRVELEKSRAGLPGQVATLSANASRYAEELMRLEGRAREVMEAKLNAESEKLAAAEHMLVEVEKKLADLADAEVEGAWVCKALADFASVWALMTPENRGRLLRALVSSVKVDEGSGTVELHIVSFATVPEARRLDGEPKEAA